MGSPEELHHYACRVANNISHVRKMLVERGRPKVQREWQAARMRGLLRYALGLETSADIIKELYSPGTDLDEELREQVEDWDLKPFDPNDWPQHELSYELGERGSRDPDVIDAQENEPG